MNVNGFNGGCYQNISSINVKYCIMHEYEYVKFHSNIIKTLIIFVCHIYLCVTYYVFLYYLSMNCYSYPFVCLGECCTYIVYQGLFLFISLIVCNIYFQSLFS